MAATTAMVVAGVQTGVGYMSHQQAAQAAKMRGQFEEQVAERNAKLAEKQGEDTLNVGNLEENRDRLQTEQAIGASRAAAGASGSDVSSGSNADVRESEQLVGEIDALTIRNNAARQAWGYDVEAANERMQGKLAVIAGNNEAETQEMASYSTLLGGASNMYAASKLRVSSNKTVTPPANPDPGPVARMVQRNSNSSNRN